MSTFLNARYADLEEYTPGEQPRDRRYIKLNTNESPFPLSEAVVKAVATAASNLRLYSDPTCHALKKALADRYQVPADCVFVGNGSDDILNFAFMAFGGNGVVYPSISYGFYRVFANLHGIPATEIPLLPDFSIDITPYRNAHRLVVIANPNAPTGLLLPVSQIEILLQQNPDSVVLIDEAYIDFGGESCLPLLKQYENLLVVRTFSKSRSLAGARLGFAFGSPAVIADLEKLKYSTNPYNVNSLTQAAGLATLQEDGICFANCCRIIENREYTVSALSSLGFTLTDSKANFVFAKSDRLSGEDVYRRLREKGILVRHFNRPEIADYTRITIGSRTEMEALVTALRELLEDET